MIKVGNIVIDPTNIDTIFVESRTNDRGNKYQCLQIIYKSGVVKNFNSSDIGITPQEFVDQFIEISRKEKDKELLKIMTMLNPNNNV